MLRNRNPRAASTRRALRPIVDTLEGRALLSALAAHGHKAEAAPTTVTRIALTPLKLPHSNQHAKSSPIFRRTAAPLAAAAVNAPTAPYTPQQIKVAYGFNQLAEDGSGQTIAVVDAYSDPTIASDLHAFDAQFGLADPTLKIIQQTAGGQPPAYNSGWAGETALDVEWAHAIAPATTIELIEVASSSLANLMAGVQYAVAGGASQVSMSWGGGEVAGYDAVFDHPGVTFLNSSGDSGYGASTPGTSPYVTAVGGTSLALDPSGSRLSEVGWTGSGGGTSSIEARPSYQAGFVAGTRRGEPDVSYDADPNTGYYVYNGGSWYQVGGTSAAAPQWAGLVALVNQGRAQAGKPSLGAGTAYGTNQVLYKLAGGTSYTNAAGDFYDVLAGSNGGAVATPGYDLVTGLGSPVANKLVPALINA